MSRYRGQFEAILSSFCFGIAPIFAKKGLLSGLNPLHGVAIANVAGLIVNILFVFLSGQGRQLGSIKQYGLFFAILAGLSNSIAILTLYWAISLEKVALVVPISCTYPLFTLLFAYFFTRESEIINIWTVIGTLLIVIGIILTI